MNPDVGSHGAAGTGPTLCEHLADHHGMEQLLRGSDSDSMLVEFHRWHHVVAIDLPDHAHDPDHAWLARRDPPVCRSCLARLEWDGAVGVWRAADESGECPYAPVVEALGLGLHEPLEAAPAASGR